MLLVAVLVTGAFYQIYQVLLLDGLEQTVLCSGPACLDSDLKRFL
jgi:hypothetical protein